MIDPADKEEWWELAKRKNQSRADFEQDWVQMLSVQRKRERAIVDAATNYVYEDQTVLATATIDKIIDGVKE